MTKGPFASTAALSQIFDVTIHTIRQWVREGKIPRTAYIKVGKTYRFHVKAVQDALMYYEERRELTEKQREEIALSILDDLSASIPDANKSDEVKHAEDNLQRQVDGLLPLREPVEIDSELESILDEHDELEDL